MPAIKPPPFRELNFGVLDANEEAIEDPDLLLKGFYDYRSAAYGILSGDTWLLLGPKGAGKSAVFEHLALEWRDRWDHFFDNWNLQDFPVADVSNVRSGESNGAARSQSAWQLILLLRILVNLQDDQGLIAPKEFHAVARELAKTGQTGDDWKRRVLRWTKASATLKLPVVDLGVEVASEDVPTLQAVAILRRVLSNVRTDSKHVLALDGLDQFFFEVEEEWSSLAGLTHAIASINRLFREARLRIFVVAAIRSDIFDVLPSPESNKLKSHTVNLNWSAEGIGVGNLLWHVITEKAKVRRPEIRDVVKTYLDQPISIGPHTQIPEYFLDNTRLLPRDLIALLNILKEFHGGTSSVTEHEARQCVKKYCSEYFVGEIFNNLAGILPRDGARKVADFRDALRTLPTRFFGFSDITSELDGVLDTGEVRALLKQMFEVGGIGVRNSSGRGPEYTDFCFRRVSGAGFTLRHGFLLHNALVVAWNRPWK